MLHVPPQGSVAPNVWQRAEQCVVTVAQTSSAQAWADPDAIQFNASKTATIYDSWADSADLVIFPELNLSGYIPLKGYDQQRKLALCRAAQRCVGEKLPALASATAGRRAGLIVGFMEPSIMRNEMHNSIALLADGEIRGVYRKMHLPVEENHYFVPGESVTVIDTPAGRVGLAICYDLVFPEVARLAALQGAEILVVASCWAALSNLMRYAEVLPVARALEEQMHVVFANGVGELQVRGRTIKLFGGSRVVTAAGDVISMAGGGEEEIGVTLARSVLDEAADTFPILRDRRPAAYRPLAQPRDGLAVLQSELGGS
ncbi:carbon-nitrogen hydrolase family protein [Nocardia gipuzkoensis]|uniref:carbon-nitrogen hydrolase family protein n=1 Tax=Nocardia gipuzkoensis TaxID=2749991 RepID=UPI00237E0D66|nr:carbon-nitrogen hydrolase family protein [Nocardia gipuzkoensis]MDE1674876.1 carbon-nitrogen hydrolase family protein [Nocardia gipuzkoensis]